MMIHFFHSIVGINFLRKRSGDIFQNVNTWELCQWEELKWQPKLA